MLSKQNSIFLRSSYLLPHTVCKFKSVSDVAPNSQVKVFAQLLLQNAVVVLPNNLNEVIPLFIYIFTLLQYIAVNTNIIEYNTNSTCFDLQ